MTFSDMQSISDAQPSSDALPMAAIALTPHGLQTLRRLIPTFPITIWIPPKLADHPAVRSPVVRVYREPLKDHIANVWADQSAILFGMAAGAVVRLIAPLLRDKATDPAVLVMDDGGRSVISLCGGHQGGADLLAQRVARCLNGTAVVTGASHQLGVPGVDVLGVPFGWTKGDGNWTGVSGAIARQEPVQVIQEAGSSLWRQHLPEGHSFQLGGADLPSSQASDAVARLWISPVQRRFSEPGSNQGGMPKAQWHPRVLWVGVGCERGTPRQVIEQGIQQVCRAAHYAEGAIAGIATIDLKADERGLVELCGDRHWPLRCFSSEELRGVAVPTPSSVVEQEVGTPSVAEAAALLAASHPISLFAHETLANENSSPDPSPDPSDKAVISDDVCLRVPKNIFRLEGQPGAVTVAIAQSPQEYTGRTGQLYLVGTGPGHLDQMTPAAQGAIAQADAVIGYSLYLDLVGPLLRPGQIVEAFPITQERRRADRAIQLASWGLSVAVISSGDAGIYGMAGLVMEQLTALGWDGHTPSVQVFPGVSALQAAAARVGAPLMHDFCTISLSDLLTPWPVIEKRLNAAAQGDFVIGIYNPKSKTRTEQIAIAQAILLQYKTPDTPVAIVRSAYRDDEQITLSTLERFLDHPIDMLTVILVGNASTRQQHHWLITPRGYVCH